MELPEEMEIAAVCKEVRREDTENGRCFFGDFVYKGDIQCELEGKIYRLLQDETLTWNMIRLNLYPSILEHFGGKRIPKYVFGCLEKIVDYWKEQEVPHKLTISFKRAYTKKSPNGTPMDCLDAEILVPITFYYKDEWINIDCKDQITFICF